MPPTAHLPLSADAFMFDVDGTLVDTVDFHAEAWQRAFAQFGYDLPYARVRSQIGKGGDQLMPVFLPPEDIERQGKAIDAFRKGIVEREFMPKVQGFPKVRDLFLALKERGKRIALASSAKADELAVYEKAAGIEGLADVRTTSDDADRSKPHPDIFDAALDKLGLGANRVLVIGDTPHDMEAAGKAGVRAIGVLCGGFSEADLRDTGALDIYEDPSALLAAVTGGVIA